MRCVTLCALVGLAACGPKVDPRTPFDEDDPRAGAAATPVEVEPEVAAAPATPPVAPAPPGTGLREGTIERAALVAVLDAGPGKLLEGFEVAAEEQRGSFVGWRLVRLLPGGQALAHLDLVPGDVLIAVNRRPIVKPADLSALWAELYGAEAIVADLRRAGAPFTIRFQVNGAAAVAPAVPSAPR